MISEVQVEKVFDEIFRHREMLARDALKKQIAFKAAPDALEDDLQPTRYPTTG